MWLNYFLCTFVASRGQKRFKVNVTDLSRGRKVLSVLLIEFKSSSPLVPDFIGLCSFMDLMSVSTSQIVSIQGF